ncbi:unnamed protein product [Phytomonas sp. Hart1]|nr:unnamed protein product [Phytomonas sp. Hart1]|eukprot:CCW66831.1 unnamed protein product [Phytomonas sp. isolate Hart1]
MFYYARLSVSSICIISFLHLVCSKVCILTRSYFYSLDIECTRNPLLGAGPNHSRGKKRCGPKDTMGYSTNIFVY